MFKVIFLHGADFSYYILYPSNFQLFFAFERPEFLAILPDLPEPTYLSQPIFPLVLHCRESFWFDQLIQSRSICSSLVILRSSSSGSERIDLQKVKAQALLLGPVL